MRIWGWFMALIDGDDLGMVYGIGFTTLRNYDNQLESPNRSIGLLGSIIYNPAVIYNH